MGCFQYVNSSTHEFYQLDSHECIDTCSGYGFTYAANLVIILMNLFFVIIVINTIIIIIIIIIAVVVVVVIIIIVYNNITLDAIIKIILISCFKTNTSCICTNTLNWAKSTNFEFCRQQCSSRSCQSVFYSGSLLTN